MRVKFDLLDQSISQTTLEQVFIDFAGTQHDGEPNITLHVPPVIKAPIRNIRVTAL